MQNAPTTDNLPAEVAIDENLATLGAAMLFAADADLKNNGAKSELQNRAGSLMLVTSNGSLVPAVSPRP